MDTQHQMAESSATTKPKSTHSASLSNASAASAAPSVPAPSPIPGTDRLSGHSHGYDHNLYHGYASESEPGSGFGFADDGNEDDEDDDLDLEDLILDLDHLKRNSGTSQASSKAGHAYEDYDYGHGYSNSLPNDPGHSGPADHVLAPKNGAQVESRHQNQNQNQNQNQDEELPLEASLASPGVVLQQQVVQPSSSSTTSSTRSAHRAALSSSSSSSSTSSAHAHYSSQIDQGSDSDFDQDDDELSDLPPHKHQIHPESDTHDDDTESIVPPLTPAAASSPTLSAASTAEPVPPIRSFHGAQPSIASTSQHSASPSVSQQQRISVSSLASSIALLQSPPFGPIKRKPLSATASALATRFSIPASRKSVANSIDTLLLDSTDSQSLNHFPLPPQNLHTEAIPEQPEEHSQRSPSPDHNSVNHSVSTSTSTSTSTSAVTTAVTALPGHIRNTSVSSSARDFETNSQQNLPDQDQDYYLLTLPSTVYRESDSLSSSNASPESAQDSVHADDSRQLSNSYDIDEATETEVSPKNKNRFSFQSSVYSLPLADNDAFDDSYPEADLTLQTPLSKPPTRPTSDASQLSAYSASSPPLLPYKPQKLVLDAPLPPLPLKTEPVSAPTATIPPHADPVLSSPISTTRQSLASLNKPLPRSPSDNDYGQPTGWTPGAASQNGSFSPIPSPGSPQRTYSIDHTLNRAYSTPKNIPPHVLANKNALGYLEDLQTPQTTKALTPATTSAAPHEIDEMEDELKAISIELAASIRREMDLEDLVDRLQAEAANPLQGGNKRTSDYFSDSGYSSSKYGDYDQSREDIEKIQRKADQEKAQIRLDLTTKLQEERDKRRDLDSQIQELSAKAVRASETAQASVADSSRLKDLEKQCEDLRRRLSEERDIKANFEDLLGALKEELQSTSNERDNLRDEVVPELRARVEGLESQNAEMATQSYETTKIQQELKALRDENDALRNSKFEAEMKTKVTSLTRSNSVASFKLQKAPGGLGRSNTVRASGGGNLGGLSRSNTVKATDKPSSLESKDALLERLKDVEAQRDALHSALKSLLERQEFQNRESSKRIKSLETERTRLIEGSPRTSGYEKEIDNLRLEITVLRRRAEEAVDQKWRVENGLRGLKMDLDRAEAEIASLRSLLEANDIMVPPAFNLATGASSDSAAPVTSESLEQALLDMQAAYQQSLERIRTLEATTADGDTSAAMQRLMAALTSVTADRDAAKVEAASLRLQTMNATANAADQLKSEQALAEQLATSARRVEELAAQVSEQLAANASLRQRLADTVSRGEADRQANVSWVNQLQERLRVMEDQLGAAQTATDERVARYEEEITALKEAHSAQLQRYGSPLSSSGGLLSPALRSPGLRSPYRALAFERRSEHLSPMPSPMFPGSPRSPRMIPSRVFEDDKERLQLKAKVQELEKALTEAEIEMQNIVGKISESQIQVLMLQEERDAAMRETKKVQRELEAEVARAMSLAA